jgi:hypothetical protein
MAKCATGNNVWQSGGGACSLKPVIGNLNGGLLGEFVCQFFRDRSDKISICVS